LRRHGPDPPPRPGTGRKAEGRRSGKMHGRGVPTVGAPLPPTSCIRKAAGSVARGRVGHHRAVRHHARRGRHLGRRRSRSGLFLLGPATHHGERHGKREQCHHRESNKPSHEVHIHLLSIAPIGNITPSRPFSLGSDTEKTPLGSGVVTDWFGNHGRLAGATHRAKAQTRGSGRTPSISAREARVAPPACQPRSCSNVQGGMEGPTPCRQGD
jgi:hypothetical protein